MRPGEKLEKGIQNVYVLGEDEGLILKANEAFTDPDQVCIAIKISYNELLDYHIES